MTTFTIKVQCPVCSHILSAHTDASRDNTGDPPRPGDFSLCVECGSALIFTENLDLRLLSDIERRRLSPSNRCVLRQAEAHLKKLKEQS